MDLTKEDIIAMSDEEVVLWYSFVQQKEQAKKMRHALLNHIDIQEAERDAHTIKVDSRVVN